jgi:hypothetical protein
MSEPTLHAARQILDESLQALVKEVDGVSSERLNARPAGDGSNSLAVIAVHALSSTRSWLALATAAPLPERDRPSEFRAVADDRFGAWVRDVAGECRALLPRGDRPGADGFDLSRTATAPWRSGELADEPVTAAWALLLALTHLHEHVGHAQLTRQLLDVAR